MANITQFFATDIQVTCKEAAELIVKVTNAREQNTRQKTEERVEDGSGVTFFGQSPKSTATSPELLIDALNRIKAAGKAVSETIESQIPDIDTKDIPCLK